MQDKIRQIIAKMDVSLDREDAETKAIEIIGLGPQAFDILIELGKTAGQARHGQDLRKFMRAVIFTLSIFARKKKPILNAEAYGRGILFLADLAGRGFASAASALKQIGISASESQKRLLKSLPLTERHSRDREISLSEAVEEIKLSASLAGFKGMSQDHFALGRDEKNSYEIRRIGETLFGIRAVKKTNG